MNREFRNDDRVEIREICAILFVVMQTLELMKTHVVKTSPAASLGEAVDLMDLYQVNGLPVIDADGILCGYLAEADVLAAMHLSDRSFLLPASLGADRRSVREKPVGAFMRTSVISVPEDVDLTDACRLLLDQCLKRVPVVDAKGRVVGVLNRIDVIQAIFDGTVQL